VVKRALLIGSQTGVLRGCHGDVALMDEVLRQLGFECTRLTEAGATQAGILAGYRALIDATQPGDVLIIYYTGHGGRIRDVSSINETTNAYWQFIVPTDFDDSTTDDFRGILADELRALQLEVTTKTDNVTTILDCCHSGLMSRDTALVARFLQKPWTTLQPGAIARQEQAAADVEKALALPGILPGDADSNQRAVRAVASLPSESAYERMSDELGGVHGLFTEGLVATLRQAGLLDGRTDLTVTWDDVAAAVRAWVLVRSPQQHVLVEGPTRRRLFATEHSDAKRGWPVEVSEGIMRIPAAAVFGIGVGDRVEVLPAMRTSDDEVVHEATVVRLAAGDAVIEPAAGTPLPALESPLVAYPVEIASGRRHVVVDAPEGPTRDRLVAAISASSRLEPVDAAIAPLAHVVVDDTGMMLVNQDGLEQYATRRPVDDAQLTRVRSDLEHLVKVAILRELESGSGDEALDVPTGLTVHVTADGPPLESGVTLPVGPIYLKVHHLGKPSDPKVYANVVDLGQAGDVSVLSADKATTGIELEAKVTEQIWRGGDGGGWLHWPDDLPEDEARPETFLAIFSDAERDLRPIEAAAIVARGEAESARSGTLRHVLDLAASGSSRSAGARPSEGPAPVRYTVHRFEFLLDPDPGFQLDESVQLATSDVLVGRGTGERAPVDVSVRLLEATVLRDHSLFSADARIDTAFITRAGTDEELLLEARTWTFGRIDDRNRLSADALALFTGPVHDFLEMAIWVSRDSQDQPGLADLIRMSLDDRSPSSTPAGLMTSVANADQFAVTADNDTVGEAIEAVGRILRRFVSRSIGLHRTTLLTPDGLTSVRRPAEGLLEAHDIAFAYEVIVRDRREDNSG
jgi:hypothetical protein